MNDRPAILRANLCIQVEPLLGFIGFTLIWAVILTAQISQSNSLLAISIAKNFVNSQISSLIRCWPVVEPLCLTNIKNSRFLNVHNERDHWLWRLPCQYRMTLKSVTCRAWQASPSPATLLGAFIIASGQRNVAAIGKNHAVLQHGTRNHTGIVGHVSR